MDRAFRIALRSPFAFAAAAVSMIFVLLCFLAPQALADDGATMYRLYNPYSGEHFYTASVQERDEVEDAGWRYEGIGWIAPASSDSPVYRLYNPYVGDHHYTMDATERDALQSAGWTYEGVGWYSSDQSSVAVFREYNPYAVTGAHNFTTSQQEDQKLEAAGWSSEGVAWYAVKAGGVPIMGSAEASEEQMVALYKSRAGAQTYPYSDNAEAPTIEAFVHILTVEAESEGVRPEVVFSQAMVETGWLRFGGDVQPEQYNFAGLGATGNGNPGNSFSSVSEGLLAQIQHLKAYASTDALNNPCVDQRFAYVQRGCAPTIEELSGKWAANSTYGESLKWVLNRVLAQ